MGRTVPMGRVVAAVLAGAFVFAAHPGVSFAENDDVDQTGKDETFEIFPFPAGPEEGSFRREELGAGDRTLLDRPDQRRPSEQLTLDVFGRPLTVGLTFESRGRFTRAPFKDQRDDKNLRLAQRASLDLFYRINEQSSLYLKGNSLYRSARQRFDGHPLRIDYARDRERGVERSETWLYIRNLWDSRFSLQVGRQRITDEREWWWDENFDAIRLHYDRRRVHAELAVGQELFRTASFDHHIDPEEQNILRIFGRTTWEWREEDQIGLFFLHQNDHSSLESVGQRVDTEREDDSDADLTWAGVSARGRVKLASLGRLRYWTEAALVSGQESYVDYSGDSTIRRAELVTRHGVHGWGFDVGATWETRLPAEPTFTLGFAVGSGDSGGKNLKKSDQQRAFDGSFRQTGIQDNNGRFRGVDRFKYYGELLNPELSNLQIGTAAVGFRFLQENSVEILYHWYRQREGAKFVRGADIRRQPSGRNRSLGQEIDVVVGIEQWDHLDIELIGAAFRAGNAYGEHLDTDNATPDPEDRVPSTRGKWSYLFAFKVELNF